MAISNQLMMNAVYLRKSILWIFLLAIPFAAVSCAVPFMESAPKWPVSEICECEDASGKTGPKGQLCWEVVEEEIGRQGYYGELQKTKQPAYFAANCRAER